MADRRRIAAIVLVAAGVLAMLALVIHGPIAQDERYHAFADARPWFGIPNGADVISNVAFLVAGISGLRALRRARVGRSPPPRWVEIAFLLFSLGVATTAVGSTIYHIAPRSATLVYDRLPMSLGFAALAALVIGERLGARVGKATLAPAVVLGVGSVLLWAASLDGHGGDDLRAYVFVQYFALFIVLALVFLVPEPRTTRRPLLDASGAYGLAKAFELFDGAVLRATGGIVSGHTLKHLCAAVAAYFLVRWYSAGAANAAGNGAEAT